MTVKLKPRDYQLEALRWALGKKRAVVCMPTGTGKTLVAGLWIRELLSKGLARRVLVLEPTRFLVEQNARFLSRMVGLDARPLHGSLPRIERERAWKARVVVATPEIIVAEWRLFEEAGFDALVVDECHHTSGQDPFKTVVEGGRFRYRLGLTALVPPSRRREIEEAIGEIRCWSWTHPSIAKYIPEWVAEVYEAPLNPAERSLYESLENLWSRITGRARVLVGNAIRWLVRDGAEALRESYANSRRLREILGPVEPLLFNERVRPAHKLESLLRVLSDHEGFEKAIVFVDRIVIAKIIAGALRDYGVSMILGRRYVEPRDALRRAKRPATRIIVSTSAGEEGIDLPEADLVILWSNTASPLRFVQRLGRMLRASKSGVPRQKYAVFLVTPDTVDVDSLIDGVSMAQKAGVYVNISSETIQYLINISRRRKILDILYERPLPADMIAQALQAPLERIEAGLNWLARKGYVAYIYTWMGKVYLVQDRVSDAYNYYRDCLTPRSQASATVQAYCPRGKERAVRNAPYEKALRYLKTQLEKCGVVERVRATVFYARRGVVYSRNLSYNFTFSDERIAKLIADNIYAYPSCTNSR